MPIRCQSILFSRLSRTECFRWMRRCLVQDGGVLRRKEIACFWSIVSETICLLSSKRIWAPFLLPHCWFHWFSAGARVPAFGRYDISPRRSRSLSPSPPQFPERPPSNTRGGLPRLHNGYVYSHSWRWIVRPSRHANQFYGGSVPWQRLPSEHRIFHRNGVNLPKPAGPPNWPR